MTGARHDTDESSEKGSDTPNSYGPNLKALVARSDTNKASRQDDARESMYREPRPGEALNFN